AGRRRQRGPPPRNCWRPRRSACVLPRNVATCRLMQEALRPPSLWKTATRASVPRQMTSVKASPPSSASASLPTRIADRMRKRPFRQRRNGHSPALHPPQGSSPKGSEAENELRAEFINAVAGNVVMRPFRTDGGVTRNGKFRTGTTKPVQFTTARGVIVIVQAALAVNREIIRHRPGDEKLRTIGIDIVAYAANRDVGEIGIEALYGEILVETPASHAAPCPVIIIIGPAPAKAAADIKTRLKACLVIESAFAGHSVGLRRCSTGETGKAKCQNGRAQNACC